MAGTPQKVLNWLYSVLTSEYHDVNRTYNDVAQALAQYPTLAPRTDVYTYENGASALLLRLSGTIPVNFRGTVYRFPIVLWAPYAYPREAPMVYVTPAEGMTVRPGQHVGADGRVYHPYMARWPDFWDKSNIRDFLGVLCGVFAKEPPVTSQGQEQHLQRLQARQQQQNSAPPPVPPLPPELGRSPTESPRSQDPPASSGPALPPPPPPKPRDVPRYSADVGGLPPPVPATPPQLSTIHDSPRPVPNGWDTMHPRMSHFGSVSNQSPFQPRHVPGFTQEQFTPTNSIMRDRPRLQPAGEQPPGYSVHGQGGLRPGARLQPGQQLAPSPQQGHPTTQHPHPPHQQYQHPQSLAPQPKPAAPPAPDLLSTPLSTDIATLDQQQASTASSAAAPPPPPNPERSHLLSLLASTLHSHRQSLHQLTATSRLPPLQSQTASLQAAQTRLQTELHHLSALKADLDSNEKILHRSLERADGVVAEAGNRRVPDVDDVLVAPTVVGGQLYDLVAEERALAETRWVLGKAVDGGKIGLEVFLKQSRSLAREQFLKKALIKKISRGMGLLEE